LPNENLSIIKTTLSKLAYKIEGHKRGTYLLIHFNTKNTAIAMIKRDFQLSDYIIRSLIVKDDKIEDLTQLATGETVVEKTAAKIPEIEDVDLLAEAVESVNIVEKA